MNRQKGDMKLHTKDPLFALSSYLTLLCYTSLLKTKGRDF